MAQDIAIESLDYLNNKHVLTQLETRKAFIQNNQLLEGLASPHPSIVKNRFKGEKTRDWKLVLSAISTWRQPSLLIH